LVVAVQQQPMLMAQLEAHQYLEQSQPQGVEAGAEQQQD
jgi:hypothetical protein